MEEDTQMSSEISVIKVDAEVKADVIKDINGALPQVESQGKKDEDETDGEFIKVEKESLDGKDASHSAEAAPAQDDKPSVLERGLSSSTRELLEAQEKVKELELELERLTGTLKHSDSESAKVKNDAVLMKQKLEESEKKCEELAVSHKKLQEEMIQAEEKFSSQLSVLQEALQAQAAKHKELSEVKEAFDGINLELENSRKRMQELEHDLQCSCSEAKKFEELHKQSSLHAESETQRSLEFERLLEAAKLSAKETEGQMASLQEEVKGLYEKISETQKVEEALTSTTEELSAVTKELALSKSQFVETLSSKEAIIVELSQELELKKASESQVKNDILALENSLAEAKEDLHAKVLELEGIKLKLQEEVSARGLVEAGLKDQEAQVSTIKEDLAKVLKEKESLETTMADITSEAAKLKELCSDLEEKLMVSDENFQKADYLLSQALSNNKELEQKLESVEEVHNESRAAAATATQRNLELENLFGASNEAAEEAKAQLRELETRFIAVEQRNVELEQQLNFSELKSNDAEREIREFSEKITELSTGLREVEEEKKKLSKQMQEYQEKITQLELALNQSSLQNSELEEELKISRERSAEHEDRANMNYQHSLELEDLFQMSHKKVEDAGKKVNELELLLQTEKYRIQELEEQISTFEKKCMDAEADAKKYSDKISELASELETLQGRTSSLESELQNSHEKEREMTECLSLVTTEKKRLEDASSSSNVKLAEAENLVEILRNELNVMQEKLESIENDLNAAGLRESDVMVKLKSAEEQLQQQEELLVQATSRNSELESSHESLRRDLEVNLQEVTNKDSEVKSLFEKLKILEDQVKLYEEQIAEAAGKSAGLKEELDSYLVKEASLETANEELKRQIVEAENNASDTFAENQLLAETNKHLRSKIDELQELLNSFVSEKEAMSQELASHVSTITDITDKHSRAIELHSVTEAKMVKAETQLQEAIQELSVKKAEIKDLSMKLNVLKGELQLFKEQAHEACAVAESKKLESEETLLKLKHLESIIEELQQKEELLVQATSRNSELESLHESLRRDLEVNLQEVTNKDSEVKSLFEKLNILEDQVKLYEEQISEAAGKSAGLKEELDSHLVKMASLETSNEELKRQVVKAENDASNTFAENQLLVETNKHLRSKIDELQELLNSFVSEKEAMSQELASHVSTITDITDKHSRALELHSVTEAKMVKAEAELQEAVQELSMRNAEIKDLNMRLNALEGELQLFKEQAHEASAVAESKKLESEETLLKLKHLESIIEELQQQEELLVQATSRNSELESLHESLRRDLELNLQEVTKKDSEVKSLFEKLNILEDQVKLYEEQISEAAGKSAGLKEELDSQLVKVASLETSNEELERQVVEAENNASNTFAENQLLVETNKHLRSKIDELQELLNSFVSEKEAMSQELASHVSTITDITDKHSRAIELHSVTEAKMVKAETQLQEAIQELSVKNAEIKDLNMKLNVLEGELQLFKEQAHEASAVAESKKLESEETLLKLKHLESIIEELHTKSGHFEKESGALAEANLKLSQDLASYESKVSDLEARLSATLSQKNETVEELHNSKKAIEDLMQQLMNEEQRIQSEISSAREENSLLNETYQNAKKELQLVIIQLEEQLKEQKKNEGALKSEIENLKAECAEKSATQIHLKELEEQLVTAEAQLNEQKEADHQKYLEKEAALKNSLDDLEALNKAVIVLEKQVKELEQKLQLAEAKILEKGDKVNPAERPEGVETRSRDVGSSISTPTKRKSRKKLDAASVQTSSPSESHAQTSAASPALNFKFVLGVALISIIIGIVLGKRY